MLGDASSGDANTVNPFIKGVEPAANTIKFNANNYTQYKTTVQNNINSTPTPTTPVAGGGGQGAAVAGGQGAAVGSSISSATVLAGSGGSYTVSSGDTLSAIARKYGTTYQELAQINGIADPNRIFVGQVISLPGGDNPEETPDGGGVYGEDDPQVLAGSEEDSSGDASTTDITDSTSDASRWGGASPQSSDQPSWTQPDDAVVAGSGETDTTDITNSTSDASRWGGASPQSTESQPGNRPSWTQPSDGLAVTNPGGAVTSTEQKQFGRDKRELHAAAGSADDQDDDHTSALGMGHHGGRHDGDKHGHGRRGHHSHRGGDGIDEDDIEDLPAGGMAATSEDKSMPTSSIDVVTFTDQS